ncbi:MAG: adenylate/guanylate cyclase domain-containing protein [Pseudomonadota bacterium]
MHGDERGGPLAWGDMAANMTSEDGSGGTKSRSAGFSGASERALWGIAAMALGIFVAIGLFRGVSQLATLETRINDQLRILIAPRAEAQDNRISIITLNEETLLQFPYRSPVDRGLLAELVTILTEAGARGVVLDVLFDQPSEPEKDAALIEAVRAFPGPVVAAWGNEEAGLIAAQADYLEAFADRAGIRTGFANVVVDDDGAVRGFRSVLPGVERRSMAAEMLFALEGREAMEGGLIDWRQPDTVGMTLFQQLSGIRLTDFAKNPAMLSRLKEWFGGRIVFVGADLEQRDRHQTSLSVDGRNARTIPGVFIQAAIFAQVWDGREVPNASDPLIYAVVGLLALVGVIIGLSRQNLAVKAAALVFVVGGYLTAVYVFADAGTLFLPVAPAVASIFTAFMVAISLDSFLTQRDERFIRVAFGHYLEPAMVNQLAEDPQALRLGGDRREMSFIFTDIAGFTTMSEELPPEELTRLLNDYFDGMSDIIISHGGAIDKFIGDAVVAHFGAPTPMKDHALRALQCAAELDRFGEAFRKRNAHLGLGVTRIGVHSGVATVGNFGGRARFDYTAMGDSVNTAARLESANKRYGTRVGVSQETAELAGAMAGSGDRLPLLQTIGQIMLKGKTRPVTVYTINNDADEEFVWAYEAAFSLLDINMGKARSALDELFRTNPTDPLLIWHLKRLEHGETGTMIGTG